MRIIQCMYLILFYIAYNIPTHRTIHDFLWDSGLHNIWHIEITMQFDDI